MEMTFSFKKAPISIAAWKPNVLDTFQYANSCIQQSWGETTTLVFMAVVSSIYLIVFTVFLYSYDFGREKNHSNYFLSISLLLCYLYINQQLETGDLNLRIVCILIFLCQVFYIHFEFTPSNE